MRSLALDEIKQSRVAQIGSELRRRIERKELAVGERLPGMRQLSREFGCSLGVVQMAVSRLTAEGCLRASPREGVFVTTPREVRHAVSLVLPTLRLEQMDKIVRGVRRGLATSKMHLMIHSADGDFDDQVKLLESIDPRHSQGVIICPPTSDSYAPALQTFAQRGIPAVQATCQLSDVAMHTVTADAFEMGRMAIDYLVQRGHVRIGLVGFATESATAIDRLRGVETALRRAGLDPVAIPKSYIDTTHLEPDEPWRSGEIATESLLREHNDLSAVVAFGHFAGLGAFRAAETLGKSVPNDLSILTIGSDLQTFALLKPGMTVVDLMLESVCERAAMKLCDIISNPGEPISVTHLAPRLIERESVLDLTC